MKEKETKKKLEELKDHKIDEEVLEDVSGAGILNVDNPVAKPYGGGLSGAPKPRIKKLRNK